MVRLLFFLSLALTSFSLSIGCGSSGPASVVDGTDADAIAEYEAMIKAEEEKASSGMQDSE